MMSINRYKINRFWLCYFIIRLFYLLFSVLIYARLTTLGDTENYLSGTIIPFSLRIFFDSTFFMFFFGRIIGSLFLGNMILANFPAMLISFFIIKWAVEKLELRKYINNVFLMTIISFPNFSIWTSIWSKETFGLVFAAIIAVLIIDFIKGNYKIKKIDILGFYLCLLFNPQFMPFILQGLIFIYMAHNFLKYKPMGQLWLAIVFLCINILFLYIMRDLVNLYAGRMHAYFVFPGAGATRDNIFLEDYDFFRHLPWGMFIAFFGPTLGEMKENPLHAIAGIESLLKIFFFFYLSKYVFIKTFLKRRIPLVLPISYLMIFTGILFIHYPFGVFNSGSAIRYRSRFIFMFIILLLYLYGQRQKYDLVRKKSLCMTKK